MSAKAPGPPFQLHPRSVPFVSLCLRGSFLIPCSEGLTAGGRSRLRGFGKGVQGGKLFAKSLPSCERFFQKNTTTPTATDCADGNARSILPHLAGLTEAQAAVQCLDGLRDRTVQPVDKILSVYRSHPPERPHEQQVVQPVKATSSESGTDESRQPADSWSTRPHARHSSGTGSTPRTDHRGNP